MSTKVMVTTVTLYDNERTPPVVAMQTTTNIVEFDTLEEAEAAKEKINRTHFKSPGRYTMVMTTAVVL